MIDESPTIEEVLTAWSDASLAAELSRRLAKAGDKAVAAEPDVAAVPEVMSLIDSTVEHATQAASIAKGTEERLQGAREAPGVDGAEVETPATVEGARRGGNSGVERSSAGAKP